MSDYPARLRSMASFSPESDTITKIVPAGLEFLREVADHVAALEAAIGEISDHVVKFGCTSSDTYGLRRRIDAATQLAKR